MARLLHARTWWLPPLVLAVLVLAPLWLNDFRTGLLTEVLIFALFAASLDLIVGYTGLPSLGHALFFGVGGYAAGIVGVRLTDSVLASLAVAVVLSALVALVTGWLAVRTRGTYFLMLTLAFAQLAFSLALTWTPVTGGSNGLSGVPVFTLPGGLTPESDNGFYWYVLVAVALGYLLLRLVVGSPFGRALVGIRENEARMRAIGYQPRTYKLAAYVLSGAVGGYAGALFVHLQRFVSTSNVAFGISALALIMVIIGGRGTLYGPVLGAGLILLLRDELSARFEHFELVLGVVFILVVYFLPQGIGGLARQLRGRRGASPPPTTPGRQVEVDQETDEPLRGDARPGAVPS